MARTQQHGWVVRMGGRDRFGFDRPIRDHGRGDWYAFIAERDEWVPKRQQDADGIVKSVRLKATGWEIYRATLGSSSADVRQATVADVLSVLPEGLWQQARDMMVALETDLREKSAKLHADAQYLQLQHLTQFEGKLPVDDPFCPHGMPPEYCGNCHEEEAS